jgi:ATP-dependent protease ClpP protease subunit
LLKGEVNEASVQKFLYDLHKHDRKKELILFLDTNGGSVEHGNKIVNEVQKYNIACVAERAYSMGFVILQACKKRYITPYGRIMQHQLSYGIGNEKAKVESYVDFIGQIEETLANMQASRIGISLDKFRLKTYNDWWMFGENAVKQNCVDDVVNVECSDRLVHSNYTMSKYNMDYIYSQCPLIPEPLEIKKNGKSVMDFIFI